MGSGGSSSSGGSGPGTGGGSGPGTGGSGTGGAVATGGSGTGGAAGGAVGTGGSGTGGAAAGGSGAINITQFAGELDGYLFTAPCGDGGTGFDCTNAGCSSGQPKTTTKTFMLGGTTGTIYNMTFNVRGVVEAKNYSGTMRRAGTGAGSMPYSDTADFWAEGGTIPNSTYNTYEMHVLPRVTGAPNDYYLNARNGTGEGHESWKLGYTATIKVPGGGMINWRVYDSNCRQIMNCGPGAGSSATGCRAPGTVPLTGANPAPMAFVQPYVGPAPNGAKGQWVYIDVTNVVVAP